VPTLSESFGVFHRWRVVALIAATLGVVSVGLTALRPSWHRVTAAPPQMPLCPQPAPRPSLDCSGRSRVGIASFYADRFGGRTMADGTPMRLHGDNAASRTLPLGTIAKVTNLETGKSAMVTIRDRGPYVGGRIVDLSPTIARRIGIRRKQGLAPVEVAPIAVPLPDGTIKLGSAAVAVSSRRYF
jgi:rare lipoprotein A